jgi:hypothetical protein
LQKKGAAVAGSAPARNIATVKKMVQNAGFLMLAALTSESRATVRSAWRQSAISVWNDPDEPIDPGLCGSLGNAVKKKV